MKPIVKYAVLVLFVLSSLCHVSALTGRWRGELVLGPTKLPLIFDFKDNGSGKTEVRMDSPQQGAKGIPCEAVYLSNDSLRVECRTIGAVYSARITKDGIEGTFTQRGYQFPLVLIREQTLSDRRPQTPQPPYPYIETDTIFYSSDGTELAGTLTIPLSPAGKKYPVVVMVTGSGPQNRDEEIFEHRPFAVIADYLARNGIASFRYDDRGVASSKGNYPKATIDTFRIDAQSAFDFVKGTDKFSKVGILGHSEGGTLAIMIASEGKPDFIISLAGMVVPSKEMLMAQNIRVLDQFGITGEQREGSIKLLEELYAQIADQTKRGVVQPIDIDMICKDNSLNVPSTVLESVKRNVTARNAYFDSLVILDPTAAMKKISCPVLAINGTKDTQVYADPNLDAFRKNVKSVEIKRMAGLNHLMQHAETGDIAEYGEIRETISPEVLQLIAEFIAKQ